MWICKSIALYCKGTAHSKIGLDLDIECVIQFKVKLFCDDWGWACFVNNLPRVFLLRHIYICIYVWCIVAQWSNNGCYCNIVCKSYCVQWYRESSWTVVIVNKPLFIAKNSRFDTFIYMYISCLMYKKDIQVPVHRNVYMWYTCIHEL